MRKIIASVMAAAMMASLSVAAFAEDVSVGTAGGTGTANAVLTAAGINFNVTVPAQLLINVDADGVVTTATDVNITNNSAGAVKVTDVVFTPKTGWTGIKYGKDMSAVKVGTKEIGFKINGLETNESGAFVFDGASFPAIAAKNDTNSDQLAITYDATLAAQRTAITNETVADVVFTIGWDEAVI